MPFHKSNSIWVLSWHPLVYQTKYSSGLLTKVGGLAQGRIWGDSKE